MNSESEGGSSGRDSSSDDGDGDKGKDLLHKLFEDGGGLYHTRSLAMGLMMTAKGFCSTKSMGLGRRSILRL
jgi:hypothetical protein